MLQKIAEKAGVASEYVDKMGKTHLTIDEVRKFFLKNMDYACDSENEMRESLDSLDNYAWLNGFDDVNSFFENQEDFSISLRIEKKLLNSSAKYVLKNEAGEIVEKQTISLKDLLGLESKNIEGKEYSHLRYVFFNDLECGYYTLCLEVEEKLLKTTVIMAQKQAYLPQFIVEKQQVYGLAIQLYALRSKNNMGIGDFSDLKEIVRLMAQNGGDMVGVNPLGPLSWEEGADISPYCSISRLFVNYLYVDLKNVQEYQSSIIVQKMVASEEFTAELKRLREVEKVDYYHVFALKRKLLKLMFEEFVRKNLQINSPRFKEFQDFVQMKGQKLHKLCTFEAIVETFGKEKPLNDWKRFPQHLQDSNSFAVKDFAEINKNLVNFYAYCHWIADMQLAEIKKLCKDLGMKIGLYLDNPIGASANGFEVWENPQIFAKNMGVGAPADLMRPKGQSWGFAPYHPQKIAQVAYKPFREMMVENMKYANALRIDHAMGLLRLFWVYFEPGNPVVQGAYVYYKMQDLVAIINIESHRHKCMIIGEDLGTVPDGFREYMFEHALLSNKIFFRQKDAEGKFLAPQAYQYLSLAQSSTHDQATTYGYWLAEDIKTFRDCNLYVDEQQFKANIKARAVERRNLLEAFGRENCFGSSNYWQDGENILNANVVPPKLEFAVNDYVAKTSSAIFLARIEDIYGQIKMENVPGTIKEYDNWQIKLKIEVEDMKTDGRFAEVFSQIKAVRSKT